MAVLIGVLATPSRALAAVDIFLKIDGVIGESADTQHRNEIDLLSWSWGTSTGTGKTKGNVLPSACIQDVTIMKRFDAASPQLIMNSITATIAANGVITLRRAGDVQEQFLTLTMTNVSVVAVQIAESSEEPTESVTLHFTSMHGEYRKQIGPGVLSAPIVFDISGACN
jgi:type VI secretion system secreted protein Hcp